MMRPRWYPSTPVPPSCACDQLVCASLATPETQEEHQLRIDIRSRGAACSHLWLLPTSIKTTQKVTRALSCTSGHRIRPWTTHAEAPCCVFCHESLWGTNFLIRDQQAGDVF